MTDRFQESKVHFVDVIIEETNTDLYCKPIHTATYYYLNSKVPWIYKTFSVKFLYFCARKIYSTIENLISRINKIKMFRLWNGHPTYICNFIIKQVNKFSTSDQNAKKEEKNKLNNNEMDMK